MANCKKHYQTVNFLKASIGIICAVASHETIADVESAKTWLSSIKPMSSVANPLQTDQEVASILHNLQYSMTLNELSANVDNEASSEGLVRLILLAKAKNESLPLAWQNLALNQNEDGGFGHIEGWQSNALEPVHD